MFCPFVLVYMYIFVCLFVHQCLVVQLSMSYQNLNVMRSPKDESSQLFKFHFPCNKGERWIYIISLESVTSIQKPINQPKVAYHQVSCLLHQYINEDKFATTIKEFYQLGQKTFCWFTILDNIKSLERYISGNLVKISSYKGFGTLQVF